jgi:cystathionine beta-synthase
MSTINLPKSETMHVFDDILQTIGKTPLVRLNRIGGHLACALYAKLEFFNPGSSVKDRIALNIVEEAEKRGELRPGGTVVEATSGNTGVGLAIVCALKGYKSIFVIPDKMSHEKIQLLRAFGSRVVITPTAVEPEDPRSNYNVAQRLVDETPNAILANQYHNPQNPRSHYETTGPEIWEQTQGQVTDVVIGMGTGGTISGVGRYLKEKNPKIRMVGVDPAGSILLDAWRQGGPPEGVEAATYKVEGIGEDFLPSTLHLDWVDEVVRVTDKESFLWARRLVKEEGIFAGGSSGSAIAGALGYARDLPADRLVVIILPDTGSRYLSKFYDDKWMRENGFLETTWSEVTLREVLATKSSRQLITANLDDPINQIIATMKARDISQVPVLARDGTLAGLVTEVDLLKHMLEIDHPLSGDDAVEPVVQTPEAVYPASASLEEVMPEIVDGDVILITEADRPSGILTKIDILDFLSQEL